MRAQLESRARMFSLIAPVADSDSRNYSKDDQQRKKHERLDQRQTQNHHGLNFSCSSRIPRGALTGRCADARLSNSTTKNRNRETDAGRERHVALVVYRGFRRLVGWLSYRRKRRHQHAEHGTPNHSYFFHFSISVPKSHQRSRIPDYSHIGANSRKLRNGL